MSFNSSTRRQSRMIFARYFAQPLLWYVSVRDYHTCHPLPAHNFPIKVQKWVLGNRLGNRPFGP
jgi:hypothetical protein